MQLVIAFVAGVFAVLVCRGAITVIQRWWFTREDQYLPMTEERQRMNINGKEP